MQIRELTELPSFQPDFRAAVLIVSSLHSALMHDGLGVGVERVTKQDGGMKTESWDFYSTWQWF